MFAASAPFWCSSCIDDILCRVISSASSQHDCWEYDVQSHMSAALRAFENRRCKNGIWLANVQRIGSMHSDQSLQSVQWERLLWYFKVSREFIWTASENAVFSCVFFTLTKESEKKEGFAWLCYATPHSITSGMPSFYSHCTISALCAGGLMVAWNCHLDCMQCMKREDAPSQMDSVIFSYLAWTTWIGLIFQPSTLHP